MPARSRPRGGSGSVPGPHVAHSVAHLARRRPSPAKPYTPKPACLQAIRAMPGVGFEPTNPCGAPILSRLRIPIPPPGRGGPPLPRTPCQVYGSGGRERLADPAVGPWEAPRRPRPWDGGKRLADPGRGTVGSASRTPAVGRWEAPRERRRWDGWGRCPARPLGLVLLSPLGDTRVEHRQDRHQRLPRPQLSGWYRV
jgi:hypothetical protein